jgi:hypothetical protein
MDLESDMTSMDGGKPRADSEEAIEVPRRIFEVNTVYDKKNKERRFMNNRITTSRYTCLSFLPKNLFEQFSKMANFYFLMMGLLELWPTISDSNGQPIMLMPLTFVVGVAMIKDLIEDHARKKADSKDNNTLAKCCPRG